MKVCLPKGKFGQWWVILLGVNGLLIFGVFKQVISGQKFGDELISE